MDNVDRVQKAQDLFLSGYNCAQAVMLAFSDLYNVPQELALKIAAPFGGGIGRMRQTCGAACGMFLLAGLERGAVLPTDKESKAATYALVQKLAAEFKACNGSLICAELLGLRAIQPSAVPEERTPQYYAKRPCLRMVESACRIYQNHIDDFTNR